MPTRFLITDFVWPSTAPEREVLGAGLGEAVEVVEALASRVAKPPGFGGWQ